MPTTHAHFITTITTPDGSAKQLTHDNNDIDNDDHERPHLTELPNTKTYLPAVRRPPRAAAYRAARLRIARENEAIGIRHHRHKQRDQLPVGGGREASRAKEGAGPGTDAAGLGWW